MYERKVLGFKEASGAIDVMMQEAKSQGKGYSGYGCFAVMDYTGNLIVLARMDGTATWANEMAIKKANTAAMWGITTRRFLDVVNKRPYGMSSWGGNYTTVPGGFPIIPPDAPKQQYMMSFVIGSIGVAHIGGGKDDENVAIAGLRYIEDVLWSPK